VEGQNHAAACTNFPPPKQRGTSWTKTTLYAFCSKSEDGNEPIAGIISDSNGRLYGTTYKGGSHNAGNVFALSPPAQQGDAWKERNLYSFETASDGRLPSPGGLILDASGALYGMLQSSEQDEVNAGSVFQLTPSGGGSGPWAETVLYTFTGTPDGYGPTGSPVFDSSGALYGATAGGGQYGAGSIFSLTPPTVQGEPWTEIVLYSFAGSNDGYQPDSGLVEDGTGALYGVTSYGGILSCGDSDIGCGTVYKLIPPSAGSGSWTEETLHSFAGDPDGSGPEAPVLLFGTSVYGTTTVGGTGPCSGQVGPVGCGTVFQITQ
jgi:uncharacterized repeat protein (TIGR03803 family)